MLVFKALINQETRMQCTLSSKDFRKKFKKRRLEWTSKRELLKDSQKRIRMRRTKKRQLEYLVGH